MFLDEDKHDNSVLKLYLTLYLNGSTGSQKMVQFVN